MSQPLRKEHDLYYLPLPEEKVSGKRTEPQRSFKFSKSRLPGLVALLILSYLAISLGSQFSKLSIMQQDVQRIQQEIEQRRPFYVSKRTLSDQAVKARRRSGYLSKRADRY